MSEIIRDNDPPQLGVEPDDDDKEIDPILLEPTEGFDSEPLIDEGWEGRHQPPVDVEKEDR